MLKILIIDDSAIIRDRLTDMLTELDDVEIVGGAKSALNGLDLVRSRNPDLVILDIKMPGLSGLEIISEIKRTSPLPCLVILTNYPYNSYRVRCKELGADYFFDKSTEFDEVISIITEIGKTASEEAKRKKS